MTLDNAEGYWAPEGPLLPCTGFADRFKIPSQVAKVSLT